MSLSSNGLASNTDSNRQSQVDGAALVVRDVSLVFPDGDQGLHVLADISFKVRTEEFFCILGPSGSGKST